MKSGFIESKKGFTLIETLLYIFLLSALISSSIFIFYQILSSEAQGRAQREVESEADFFMRKMVWALSSAQSVSQPASGATSTVLSLSKYGFAQNPIVFDASSGAGRISRGGGAAVPLTSGNVNVSQLIFTHLPAVGTAADAVRVVLSVSASSSEYAAGASTTLENTIYIP